jgi:hypothetical protein
MAKDKSFMGYKVDTFFNKDLIIQEVKYVDTVENTQTIISRQVMDLKDDGVRQCLISLGWTPPKEDN